MAKSFLISFVIGGVLWLNSSILFAQNGGNAEESRHKSVEELMMKENPNKARAVLNKEKYLVLENMRNGKATRYYIGDFLNFKTKDDLTFQERIVSISDSSFVTSIFNEVFSKYESREIPIKDVKIIYTRKGQKMNWFLPLAPAGYFLLDWAYYSTFPKDKLLILGILEAAIVAYEWIEFSGISKKLTGNYRLRVFQSY